MTKEQKQTRYERIYQQVKKLTASVKNPQSRMATIIALLHHKFAYYFWTGFYFLRNGNLEVGAYQGPVACLVLKKDTGVCWAAIKQKKPILVHDVSKFPGHIACNSLSKSEIVIPIYDNNNELTGVLDIDSKELSSFDETDMHELEKIVKLIYEEL
ncbi:MAG: histidine kinase [Bacteroidia bacterium]|nr:MAG: histidine kinase [Bacteroidia bacterium]